MDNQSPSPASLSIEDLNGKLSRYEIHREIGRGAMGVVYEARQKGVGRRVALKVLPSGLALRERTVARFLREAASMGKLSHPLIVDVFEVESMGGLHYFAMRFIEGPPLDRVLKAGPLALSDVIQIGRDVADALAHAHSRGVMHRDIKPANLLRDGERVVLTDFGLARPLDARETGAMTESGDLVGTPLYMSPEQIGGELDKVDGRSDVWGLGVTLYELLVQRSPFVGTSAQAILNRILQHDPARISRLRDDVPADLEAIVFKCLEKDPSRRYQTAAAVRDDLASLQQGLPVSARKPRFFDPVLRWVRRHRVESAAAVILAALAVGFALRLSDVQEELSTAHGERQRAENEQERSDALRELLNAQRELLEARFQGTSELAEERERAKQRLDFLLDAFPDQPEIAVSAFETAAAWARRDGQEEALILYVESLPEGHALRSLTMQAAMLSGLERYDQALQIHSERARLRPTDPLPYLDAARILQRMAQDDLKTEPSRAMARLQQALRFHGEALGHAARIQNREYAVDILMDRSSCYQTLGRLQDAKRDLDAVIEHDPSRADARAMRFGVERALEAIPRGPAAIGSLATDTSASEAPIAPPEIDTRDLRSAGRGVQLILRGLNTLLAEEPARAEPASAESPQD